MFLEDIKGAMKEKEAENYLMGETWALSSELSHQVWLDFVI